MNINSTKRSGLTIILASSILFGAGFSLGTNDEVFAEELRIAVIDSTKIMEGSLAYKNIVSQMNEKQKSVADNIQKEDSKLKKKYQELETQKKILSDAAVNTRSDEIAKEGEKLQKYAYSEHSLLEKAYSESIKVLGNKLSEIVKKQAESKKYDIVVERAALSYAKESIDITQLMLDEVNKELPAVRVHFEKSAEMPKINEKLIATDGTQATKATGNKKENFSKAKSE